MHSKNPCQLNEAVLPLYLFQDHYGVSESQQLLIKKKKKSSYFVLAVVLYVCLCVFVSLGNRLGWGGSISEKRERLMPGNKQMKESKDFTLY